MYKGLSTLIHLRRRVQDVTEVFLRRAVENSRSRTLQAGDFILGRNPTGHYAPVEKNLVPHRDCPVGLLSSEGEVDVVLENEVLHTTIEPNDTFLR